MKASLSVEGLAKHFSGVRALQEVDLQVEPGEILGLVGPNGSGKTTLFNCVTGFVRASGGSIAWQGREISLLAPDQIARLGVVRTFQQKMVFPRTTVSENARMALLAGASAVRSSGRKRFFGDVHGLLEFLGLSGLEQHAASDIPFGSARKLGVGLALAANPELLLLDEPAAGLNQDETLDLSSLVLQIRELGVTVCVIEHDMDLVMSICERIIVLHAGRKIAEGKPADVASHPEVLSVYLGSVLLEVDQINSYYGAVQALRDVSLEVDDGEAVAVLGPNGAGKSTLLRSISGLIRCRRGHIRYQGKEISRARTDAIVRMGVVQVPEGRHIFSQMSVRENLLMGAFVHGNGAGLKEHLQFVYSLFPDLEEKASRMGKELSGGQQQMLAIGRALMGRPSLLLLDEPSLGLSPIMVEQVAQTIGAIQKDLGTSILLVEQDAGLALELTSRVYVMQTGRITLSGLTSDVSTTEIRRAYLGQARGVEPN